MNQETRELEDATWLSIRAIFYIFSQRVADGMAKEPEVTFMSKVFDLANAHNDWNVKVNV